MGHSRVSVLIFTLCVSNCILSCENARDMPEEAIMQLLIILSINQGVSDIQ